MPAQSHISNVPIQVKRTVQTRRLEFLVLWLGVHETDLAEGREELDTPGAACRVQRLSQPVFQGHVPEQPAGTHRRTQLRSDVMT